MEPSRNCPMCLLVVLLVGAACPAPPAPTAAPPDPGEAVYRADACSGCHGSAGQGGATGPALTGLARHWTEDSLVAFLGDPYPVMERDARLRAMRESYGIGMPPAQTTSEERLRQLSRWLLTR
ncbi:MAG: c-type cytochrome [Acidobacteriota bacterium]